MKYLLDTNICIFLIRHKSSTVLARLKRHAIADVAIAAVTAAELQYGVHKSARPQQNQEALDQFLVPLAILPFDESAAAAYGRIRAYLEKQGTPIGALDTLIAAQAISQNLIMVTNNVREFARVPDLTVEDWTQP